METTSIFAGILGTALKIFVITTVILVVIVALVFWWMARSIDDK